MRADLNKARRVVSKALFHQRKKIPLRAFFFVRINYVLVERDVLKNFHGLLNDVCVSLLWHPVNYFGQVVCVYVVGGL